MNRIVRQLTFNHLGLAIKRDRDALAMLGLLGYDIGDRIFDPLQNVFLRMCTAPGRPSVELVQPGDRGPSPVDSIVSRFGELMYHTCYETPDLAQTIRAIEESGLRCVVQAERRPAVLFGGRHVSFYKIVGWGTIELLEPI